SRRFRCSSSVSFVASWRVDCGGGAISSLITWRRPRLTRAPSGMTRALSDPVQGAVSSRTARCARVAIALVLVAGAAELPGRLAELRSNGQLLRLWFDPD